MKELFAFLLDQKYLRQALVIGNIAPGNIALNFENS